MSPTYIRLTMLIGMFSSFDNFNAKSDKICQNFGRNSNIKSITQWMNGTKLVFKSGKVWEIGAQMSYCKESNVSEHIFGLNTMSAIAYYPRFDYIYVFRGDLFVIYQNKYRYYHNDWVPIIYKSYELRYIFEEPTLDAVDAALILINPDYDNFILYDFMYLFRGQRVYVFGIYEFDGKVYFENLSKKVFERTGIYPNLSQISTKLPNSIDAAFSDNQFVHLFKDNVHYRMDSKKFLLNPFEKELDLNFHDINVWIEPRINRFSPQTTTKDRLNINVVHVIHFVVRSGRSLNIPLLQIYFLSSILLSAVICVGISLVKLIRLSGKQKPFT